ncbi:MAG: DUF308 domain-containing protein [Clostridia bacterium]|nr:DUF308 domain-containing protein [Clostridia bacterium]
MKQKKKNISFTWVQACWAAAGAGLFAAGLHVVNVPDAKLLSVANHLGLAMLFAGIINLFVYYKKHEEIHGSHWLLADGMSTTFLSIFPLFNQMILPVVIPFFFGIWELFSGILKFIEAKELQEEKVTGWQWFLAVGIIELFSGIASMIKPIDDFVGMNHVIAIILLVQSSGFLFKIYIYHHLADPERIRCLRR